MMKSYRLLMGAVLVLGPGLVALAQVSIAPPPETTTKAATIPAEPILPMSTKPEMGGTPAATAPASTLPSSQSVLESLLNERPPVMPMEVNPASTNPALSPTVEAVAPHERKAKRIPEGQLIWDRTGRLVRDDKTGTYVFAFDTDGKGMNDPPMALLPSHLLMAMEDSSEKGTRSVKFKISGEVTEYRGKNYLLIKSMRAIPDLNQGIGK